MQQINYGGSKWPVEQAIKEEKNAARITLGFNRVFSMHKGHTMCNVEKLRHVSGNRVSVVFFLHAITASAVKRSGGTWLAGRWRGGRS